MAIPFLNHLDLRSVSELQNAILHKTTTATASNVEGKFLYDTGTNTMQYYNGTAWINLDGTDTGITSVTLASDGDATSGNTITANGTLTLSFDGTSSEYVNGEGNLITFPAIPSVGNGTLTVQGTGVLGGLGTFTANQSGNTTISVTHDNTSRTDTTSTDSPAFGGTFEAVQSVTTNATGHVTSIDVSTVTLQTPEFFVNADSGTSQTIEQSDTLTISGGTNISTVVGATDTVTVNLDDNVTLAGTLTVNGTGQSSFAGQVTIPILPVASTDAASKDYVDNAVVGGLIYQGGYNANLNSPDLTTSPNSIEKGWTYTVTADGTFFGEQLRVGDVLIAEQDNPSASADWTTVQNNVDLASLTQVGIGNVVASPAASLKGLSVTYSNGTAKAGLNLSGLTTQAPSNNALAFIPFYDQLAGANLKVGLGTLAGDLNEFTSKAYTISDTDTITYPFTLTDQNDIIIQLVDTVTNETVYADVDRISPTQATITFASTPTNDVRVLIQKIG